MTHTMGVAELKRRFSEVLNRVALRGEQVVVHRRGRSVAVISPYLEGETDLRPDRPPRGLAAAAGAWEKHEDIDDFIAGVRSSRDEAADRLVEPLE